MTTIERSVYSLMIMKAIHHEISFPYTVDTCRPRYVPATTEYSHMYLLRIAKVQIIANESKRLG